MHAAKTGFIAEFETGYLQREIRVLATVAGGTDTGLRKATDTGYATGRLVAVGAANANGVRAITAPTGVTATSIGNATHIIAQSDDTIRGERGEAAYPENYSTLPNLICKNRTTAKTVALYKIVNADDIKIISKS